MQRRTSAAAAARGRWPWAAVMHAVVLLQTAAVHCSHASAAGCGGGGGGGPGLNYGSNRPAAHHQAGAKASATACAHPDDVAWRDSAHGDSARDRTFEVALACLETRR